MNVYIRTRDRNQWKGQLQEGWFEVEGLRCKAEQVKSLNMNRESMAYDAHGDIELVDGTHLRVQRVRRGLFWREIDYAISGEVTIFLSSMNRAKTFAISDIESLWLDLATI
jgi:hypothetical protein